jgi:PleD family two-component response regulator
MLKENHSSLMFCEVGAEKQNTKSRIRTVSFKKQSNSNSEHSYHRTDSNPDHKASVKTMIKKVASRYKQRKLKILVANDNTFQLLIISSALRSLNYVDRIDEA